MAEDKDLLKAYRRVWTMAVLVLLVFVPSFALVLAVIAGWTPLLLVLPALGAGAALEYGLWTYRDWGRNATQIAGVLILTFMAFLFERNPTTYQALNWFFRPFNLTIAFSGFYCLAAGFSKGVREIFKARGALGEPAVRNGRTSFLLKRGLIIFVGYVLWSAACRGADQLADRAVSEAKAQKH